MHYTDHNQPHTKITNLNNQTLAYNTILTTISDMYMINKTAKNIPYNTKIPRLQNTNNW